MINVGTIFPQEGKWFMCTKKSKKGKVTLRELKNYKPGDKKLKMGDLFTADLTENES